MVKATPTSCCGTLVTNRMKSSKTLIKHIVIFSCLTSFFLICSYFTKSEYFNHPYPNIEEYIGSTILLIYTSLLVLWKKNRLLKSVLGIGFTGVFVIVLTTLNHLNEWHPLNLKMPFTSSQSFRVKYEPFEWSKVKPEIYGYNLNYNLVVLSACETGIGTLSKGEGALSLARGFSYAGVKNLIISLWKVNDRSTESLMASFYKNYKNTGSKSKALYNSKLDYLEDTAISSIKKSPYYWGAFVYYGAISEPLETAKLTPYILAIFSLIVIYLAFLNFRIKKRKTIFN